MGEEGGETLCFFKIFYACERERAGESGGKARVDGQKIGSDMY